jgi:HK97 family phage major capsid protein
MMAASTLSSDFVRVLQALARGRNALGARAYAATAWGETSLPARVLTRFIDTGDFGSAPDYAAAGRAFIAFAAQDSIIARINSLQPMRRTAFNTSVMRQVSGGVGSWTAEGVQIVASGASFDTTRLLPRKIAGLMVATRETLLLTGPAFEQALSQDLSRAIGQIEAASFLDPSAAGDDNQPASITYGAPSVPSSGSDPAAIQADVRALLAVFKGDVQRSVWLLNASDAMSLNMIGDDVGGAGLTANGGTWFGLPAICSSGAPAARQTR